MPNYLYVEKSSEVMRGGIPAYTTSMMQGLYASGVLA
jgi:hypothetical protein